MRASPDGYTLFYVATGTVLNALLYSTSKFSLISDIAPVVGIARGASIMVVNPLLPARTIPEFIAYAKANPGAINMASGGVGVSSHLIGELFKIMTSVNMLHVPYRGTTPALIDVISGQAQVMFETLSACGTFSRS